jgi:hypothetical protein
MTLSGATGGIAVILRMMEPAEPIVSSLSAEGGKGDVAICEATPCRGLEGLYSSAACEATPCRSLEGLYSSAACEATPCRSLEGLYSSAICEATPCRSLEGLYSSAICEATPCRSLEGLCSSRCIVRRMKGPQQGPRVHIPQTTNRTQGPSSRHSTFP